MKRKIFMDILIIAFAIIGVISSLSLVSANTEVSKENDTIQETALANENQKKGEEKNTYEFDPASTKLGDVDNDGDINAGDAAGVLIRVAYIEANGILPSEEDLRLGDVDKDEKLTAIDASYILQFAAESGAGGVTDFDEYMKKQLE